MGKFYLFPEGLLLANIMLAAFAVMLQTLCITFGFRRLSRSRKNILENMIEVAVLFELILLCMMLAEVSYHHQCGFVYPGGYRTARRITFIFLSVMSMAAAWNRRIFWPLMLPLASALMLPAVEDLAEAAFPVLFEFVLFFWIVRCFHQLLLRKREQKHQLTVLSVKEAVDTLDSGILFCQPDGQILLQNSRMQKLMQTMTGEFQYNGRAFYTALRNGNVLPPCRKGEIGETEDQLAYWLPDGSIWVFDLSTIDTGKQKSILLTASDNTERWKATYQLWQQNQKLEKRNQELKLMLDNLETICRTEETIHVKSRVHDVLGQKISLLLRAMREHREPDDVLLSSFAEGLPEELTEISEERNCALDTIVEAFRGLGVAVHVEGSLPEKESTARTLTEIAAEAVTNAVRHGYASEVWISLLHENGMWKMKILDSGLPSSKPVSEGGGLKGMRRKAEAEGGTFSYSTDKGFCIQVIIPEGEAL